MMKQLAVSLTLLVMAVSAHAQAAASAAPPAAPSNAPVEVKATGTPGKAVATRSEKVTATVKTVDVANRKITLQGPKGKEQTFSVGPQVQRLRGRKAVQPRDDQPIMRACRRKAQRSGKRWLYCPAPYLLRNARKFLLRGLF